MDLKKIIDKKDLAAQYMVDEITYICQKLELCVILIPVDATVDIAQNALAEREILCLDSCLDIGIGTVEARHISLSADLTIKGDALEVDKREQVAEVQSHEAHLQRISFVFGYSTVGAEVLSGTGKVQAINADVLGRNVCAEGIEEPLRFVESDACTVGRNVNT